MRMYKKCHRVARVRRNPVAKDGILNHILVTGFHHAGVTVTLNTQRLFIVNLLCGGSWALPDFASRAYTPIYAYACFIDLSAHQSSLLWASLVRKSVRHCSCCLILA